MGSPPRLARRLTATILTLLASSSVAAVPSTPAGDRAESRAGSEADGPSARGLLFAAEAALEVGDGAAARALLVEAWRAGGRDASFVTARSATIAQHLHELSRDDGEARRVLDRLRAETAAAVLRGSDWLAATRLATIDRVRGNELATLRTWERAVERLRRDDEGRRILFEVVEPQLMERRRYADVLEELGDVPDLFDRFGRTIDAYASTAGLLSAGTGDDRRLEPLRLRVVREGADAYEVLLGISREEAADVMAGLVLRFDDSLEARTILEERALRAGDSQARRRLDSR